MPKATKVQRERFGRALGAAMRAAARNDIAPQGIKGDEWLGREVGMTAQAIRNYMAGIREPKSAEIVERLEDVLQIPRNQLGQFLGYGPAPMPISPVLADQLSMIEAQATGHPGWSVVGRLSSNWQDVRAVEERLTALEETMDEIRAAVQALLARGVDEAAP